jgi:voltage-gated potassium channel
MGKRTLKSVVATLLNPAAEDGWRWRIVDIGLLVLIVANVIAFIVDTIPEMHAHAGAAFETFERVSIVIFSAEYLLRLWTADLSGTGRFPRIQYAVSIFGLIDLFAILPFYLQASIDLRVLRLVRLMRIFRVFKLARHSAALRLLTRTVQRRASELAALGVIVSVVFLLSATGMYYVERDAQPDKFASIPQAMWWSVSTLTSVGYGDVFPITVLGKIFAAVTMLMGIGLIALPTGILGATLTEELLHARARKQHVCPHCGKPVDAPSS